MPTPTLGDPSFLMTGSSRRLAVLPADMPWGHAPGPAAYRMLMVGGDAIAGHGVRSHDLGPAGCLARSIAGRTGHGVDVKLVLCDPSAPRNLESVLREERIAGLDAVVLVVEPGRFGHTAAGYGVELRRVVTSLAERLPSTSPVVVIPAPVLGGAASGRQCARLAVFHDLVAAAARPVASAVVLPEDDRSLHPGTGLYRAWAEAMSDVLVPQLRDPQVWRTPEEGTDEEARQLAVGRLGAFDAAWEAEFQRIVSFARAGYGSRSASLSVVDGCRTRFLARQGVDFDVLRREDTICAAVLAKPGGIIVGDAREDPDFRHLPPVESGDAVFYAGYRVASPDGQPVAVLCVFDPEPRPVLGQDITLLADLAHAAQRRMWELHQAALG